MTVFELMAKISLDSNEYDQRLREVANRTGTTVDGIERMHGRITKAAIAGAAALGAASTALITKSVKSYAEYEQLVGGIETLYKSSANTVMQYANEAYKTAGMSANQYMEIATSFAAALTQSLGGDTAKAAEYANTAITDMSDNANKMGTSIDSIIQTYQSLSRGNFAMLDNLKLGYGGTKAELERLLEDAEKYKAAQGEMVDYSIDSYSDIVEAIHVVQQEMGITGTTAAESASTIEGSLNTAKAAAENFFTSLANSDADVSATFNELVSSIGTAAGNIIPVVGTVVGHVWELANAFPALTGVVLPAAAAFGTFAIASNVVPAISALKTAVMEFYGVLAANPIALAIALMAGLAVAAYNLVTHFSELYTQADKAAEGIRNLNRATESGVSGWVEQENAAKESMGGVQDSVDSAASNITSALEGIDPDLAGKITGAMEGAATAVEGASTQIGEAGNTAVEQYASAFENGQIGTAASNAVTQAVDSANSAASSFSAVGQTITTQISTSINAGAGAVSSAVSAMLTTAIIAGNVATGQATAVGQNVGNMLSQGINAGAGAVSSAMQNLITTAVSIGNAAAAGATAVGQNIGNQIASGASTGAGAVASAVRNVVATAISAGNAAAGGARAIGSNIARGIAAGISSGSGAIAAAARSAVQAAVAAAKAAAAISSPSKLFRDEVGYFMGLGVAAGLEDAEDETTKAAVKLARDTYSKAKEWIRRTAKMDRWSLQDELNAWIDVQAGFNEGSQQWLDAEETIFDIREKMHDEFMDDEEDRINRDIKRNKRSIAEQIAMWTEFRDKYEKNSEEWLKVDDRIFELREDLVEQHEKQLEDFGKSAEKLWKNIADAQDKYNDKLESTKDSIAGAYNLFDDVQDREVVSAEEVTTNLTRQVNVLRGFYEGLEQLSARGVSAEMVEEIRDMGPKAVDQLDALLSMSDEQLSKYAELYGEKQRIANDEALKELSGLRKETDEQVRSWMETIVDNFDNVAEHIGDVTEKVKALEDELRILGQGGNVDLLNRPIVEASKLLDVGWEDAGEGKATVFSSTFSDESGTRALNFTPIIADKNGKFVDVLEPDALWNYAERVIEGVQEDYLGLQIGSEFIGEDAIEQAERAAERIHELHEQYYLDNYREKMLEQEKQKLLSSLPADIKEAVQSSRDALQGAVTEELAKKATNETRSILGAVSEQVINALTQSQDRSREPTTINLTMADGSVLAKWIFNPLKDYAASKGQPIVNAT